VLSLNPVVGRFESWRSIWWSVVATKPASRKGRIAIAESTNVDYIERNAIADPLTELLRRGARELRQSAV